MPRARKRPSDLKGRKPKTPWAGILPECRPTPERLRQGGVIQAHTDRDGNRTFKIVPAVEPRPVKENGAGREVGKAGIVISPTPIDAALHDGLITERQHQAASAFEYLSHGCREVGGRRDSLDFSPRGHSGYNPRREAVIAQNKRTYGKLKQGMSYLQYLTLKSVVVEHHEIGGRLRNLIGALDHVAEFFGFPETVLTEES